MAKSAAPRDGVTVVIPAHNAAAALERVLPAWGAVLTNLGRPFEIIVVNDGSTDGTAAALAGLAQRVPHLRVLHHDARRGFGASLRTALTEAKQPLLLYCGVDYPYTPTDIKPMLERIDLRDEILGKQPDLISGFRAGRPRPFGVKWIGRVWKLFWRIFAGLPMSESAPWYGWSEWWYRARVGWVFGVPLADVNSAFKLYRTAFLKRFPIQSDGDFVHTELVAKATFLTSIMDEIPLTPRPELLPVLGSTSADERVVFRNPIFAFDSAPAPVAPPASPPAPSQDSPPAPSQDSPPAPSQDSPPAPSQDSPPAPSPVPPPAPEPSPAPLA
jgi:glycosyltransferase involved in cell wall biosynthesis